MNKTYYFHPDKNVLKQGYVMEDAAGNTVYEAKVLKQPLIGAATVDFINHISNQSEEHKVGHVATLETFTNDIFFTRKSWFKFDDINIWKFLNEEGVVINSSLSGLSVNYQVFYESNLIASIRMDSKASIGGLALPSHNFVIEVEEENLDLAFLVAYSVSKTETAVN